MRYFEIAKPSAQHILADADPRDTAPGEPVDSGIRKPFRPNQPAGVSNLLNQINRPSHRPRLSSRHSQ
jgi:hypothetical protein